MTVELPIPLSRAELYLAKAAGMAGITVPSPESREECYLAYMAGVDPVDVPAPASLKEQWLYLICGGVAKPLPVIEGSMLIGQQMVDTNYLAAAAGLAGAVTPASPRNRAEEYFAEIAQHGPFARLKTVSGVSLVLNDINHGIESLNYFYGDTYQQTYSGKNFLNLSGKTTTVGITGTVVDGSTVTVTGSPSSTGGYEIASKGSPFNIPAGTYTLCVDKPSSHVINLVLSYSGGKTSFRLDAGQASATNTLGGDATEAQLYWAVTSGVTYNETIKFQLVSGSTPDYDFEPYVGGTASPNPDYPQDVQVVAGRQLVTISGEDQSQEYEINLGKNLWGGFSADMTRSISGINFNNLANGDIFISAGTTNAQANSLSSSQVAGTDRLLTLQAGTYSISGAIGAIRVQLINSTGGVVANDTGAGATVTLSSPTQAFVRVSIEKNEVVTDTTIHPQLELGTSPSSYASYFTPIELCKIGDYQDYIYKNGDDWYLHKEIGEDTLPTSGYYIWETHMDACMYYRNYEVPGALFQNNSTALKCRDFVCKAQIPNMTEYYNRYHNDGYGITLKTQTHGIGIQNIKQTTLTDFHNWIRDNPITIYYALATPTDTQITNAALIAQLDALDSATLPSPDANVVVTGNIAGAIDFTYYATP